MSKLKKLTIFDVVTAFLSLICGLLATIFQEPVFIFYLLVAISTVAFFLAFYGGLFLLFEFIYW